jgi:NAD(P)H-quinone oxidoreductase subunit 4
LATINNLVARDLNAVKSLPKTNIFAGNKSNQILQAPTI